MLYILIVTKIIARRVIPIILVHLKQIPKLKFHKYVIHSHNYKQLIYFHVNLLDKKIENINCEFIRVILCFKN